MQNYALTVIQVKKLFDYCMNMVVLSTNCMISRINVNFKHSN